MQPHLIVHKVVTGQPLPFDGVLAFLDPLVRCAALVVEPHHPFGRPGLEPVCTKNSIIGIESVVQTQSNSVAATKAKTRTLCN